MPEGPPDAPGTPDAGGPLADLLVVDLSRALAGPYATLLLGDLGARVIKVEHPRGDESRTYGPPFVGPEGEEQSTYFLSANRNKESVVLDLKDEGDRDVLVALVSRADVLVENFRVGVLDRLGFSVERLEQLNPRLVTLSITGFGADGPDSARPGYDQILQGEGGFMSFTGPDPDSPTRAGVPIADILAGMFGVHGVLAALHERERSGRGQVVNTSLLSGMIGVHTFQATRYLVGGEVPRAAGNSHPTLAPYGVFPVRDGLINIAVGNDQIWERLAPLVGIDPADARFSSNRDRVRNREALRAALLPALHRRDRAEWLAELASRGIPAGEIRNLAEVYASAQVRQQGLVQTVAHPTLGDIELPGNPIRLSRSRRHGHRPPPLLGEHSEQVRSWLTETGTPTPDPTPMPDQRHSQESP
jgi:crotonobetainyl-CoA:carnitine CoA-transferase CaiB-like acyl-CoA transferase